MLDDFPLDEAQAKSMVENDIAIDLLLTVKVPADMTSNPS